MSLAAYFDSDSSSESEFEPSDSARRQPRVAHPQQSSFAVQLPRNTESMMNEWSRSDDFPAFQRSGYQLQSFAAPTGPSAVPRTFSSGGASSISSMATAFSDLTLSSRSGSASTRTSTLPSLSFGGSSISSRTSARTSEASSVYQHKLLEVDEHGVLRCPEEEGTGSLACAFHFLKCNRTFEYWTDWDMHARTVHLKNLLPTRTHCPIEGCAELFSASTGQAAWNARYAHVVDCHELVEEVDTNSRANAIMVEHLRMNELVSYPEYQELRVYGRLGTNTAPVVMRTEPRRERRADVQRMERPRQRR